MNNPPHARRCAPGLVAAIVAGLVATPACETTGDPDPGGVVETESKGVLSDSADTKLKLTSGASQSKVTFRAGSGKAGTTVKARLVAMVMKKGAVPAGGRVIQILPSNITLSTPATLVMGLSHSTPGTTYRAIHGKETDSTWTVGEAATEVALSELAFGGEPEAAYSIGVAGGGLWGIAEVPEDACPAPTGAVVSHGKDITADESWAGDGSVHAIAFGITVRPGATLTLESCAVVTIPSGVQISVAGDAAMGKPARLVAKGTAARPVTITRKDPAAAWFELRALGEASFLDFSYTTVEGGGDPATAMIHLRGKNDPLAVDKMLRAVSLTLKGAGSRALWLESGAAFTDDSTALAITGGGAALSTAASGDLELTPRAVNTMPAVVEIHDNAQNLIHIGDGGLQIERDVRVRSFGVPYYFAFDRVRVHSKTATPKLTIEAGVELRFDDYLVIGSGVTPPEPGILEVLGSTEKPVVFTSFKSTHAAGDWPGIWLSVAAGSTISHARIEAAGGPNGISSSNCKPAMTSDNAALFIGDLAGGTSVPAPADFTDVAIVNSASHGINAMWTAADFGPDLTSGFTFTAIAGCKQTKNRRTTGCGTEAGCLVP